MQNHVRSFQRGRSFRVTADNRNYFSRASLAELFISGISQRNRLDFGPIAKLLVLTTQPAD
jgi:hypothetical protein